jgi:hypothetical protein
LTSAENSIQNSYKSIDYTINKFTVVEDVRSMRTAFIDDRVLGKKGKIHG